MPKDSQDAEKPSSDSENSPSGVRLSIRMRADMMREIDKFIDLHGEPKPSRFEAVRELVEAGLAVHRQKRAAAKATASEARKADYAKATADHARALLDQDEKTERLRQLRLAKEAHDLRIASAETVQPKKRAAKPAKDA
ncbi:hypothetical protein [Terrarubrum flagellatum]|uniref:hypothetical protein n=1 Tax=Terrirubrum flagellatum TaxID=2895980 RepID=UPI0031452C8D